MLPRVFYTLLIPLIHFNLAIFNEFLDRVRLKAGPPYPEARGFQIVTDSLYLDGSVPSDGHAELALLFEEAPVPVFLHKGGPLK